MEIKTNIHVELLKYKDFFPLAIQKYHDDVMINDNFEDYISASKQQTIRLKVEYEPWYYQELLDRTKQKLMQGVDGNKKHISEMKLINNVLASLKNEAWCN